jgi:xylitol oxidase
MAFQQKIRQHNWAGNLVYGTDNFFEPATEKDVVSMVHKFNKLKILGTKHSFNTIADSTDNLVSLRHLETMVIHKENNTVTVGAGVRYGTLAEYLYKNGYALHNLASLPHISVAGACATATHGSGVTNGNLSTAVTGMEFLTAAGELVTLSKEKEGDKFNGLVVHLGAAGVVTKVTLALQPTFNVRQDVYEFLPLAQLKDHLMEVLTAGYSVSLFTDWKNHSFSQVWIKSRMDAKKPFVATKEFFSAKQATRNLHPIKELSAENCTEQMGVPGPWHERLPHFKMNFTPSSGAELQAEYFVPLSRAFEALSAVDAIGDKISPHLLITEIRTIAADNFWMSPCYQQDSLAIHFTLKPDWPNVSKLLPQIESQLEPFITRPHWAKLFTMDGSIIRSRYKNLTGFIKLCNEYDPQGKFRNEFLMRNVF